MSPVTVGVTTLYDKHLIGTYFTCRDFEEALQQVWPEHAQEHLADVLVAQVGLQRVYGGMSACDAAYRKLRRTIIKALSAHFGEVAISTDKHFGMHRWLPSVKVQCDTVFV